MKKILIEVEVPDKAFDAFSSDDIAHAFFNGFRFGDDERVKYRIIDSTPQALVRAEPVARMYEDGSLHTTLESAKFRGGKVTPLYAAPHTDAAPSSVLNGWQLKFIDHGDCVTMQIHSPNGSSYGDTFHSGNSDFEVMRCFASDMASEQQAGSVD